MRNVSIELRPYFRRVEKRLKCPRSQRRALLDKVRCAAREFAEENPEATLEETAEYLGNPHEVAQGLLETLDPEELGHYQKSRQTWLMVWVSLLVVAVVAMGMRFAYLKIHPKPVVVEVIERVIIYEGVENP